MPARMVFQALAATVVRPVMAALVVPVLLVMPLHPMVALAATAVEPAARVSVVRADWEPLSAESLVEVEDPLLELDKERRRRRRFRTPMGGVSRLFCGLAAADSDSATTLSLSTWISRISGARYRCVTRFFRGERRPSSVDMGCSGASVSLAPSETASTGSAWRGPPCEKRTEEGRG